MYNFFKRVKTQAKNNTGAELFHALPL